MSSLLLVEVMVQIQQELHTDALCWSGKVVINNKLVSFTGGEITIPLTGKSRTDLLVINEEGVLIRKPGTTSVAEPVNASEKSAVAIAQVRVPASTTAMIHPQNDVIRIDPYSVKERYQDLTGFLSDLTSTDDTAYGTGNTTLVQALNKLVTPTTGIIQTWINNNSSETPTNSKLVKRSSSGYVLSRGLSIYNTDGGSLVSTWDNTGEGWMTGDFTVGTSSILARFGVKSSSDIYTGGIVFQRASSSVSYGLRFDAANNLYLGVSPNGVTWTWTADILKVNSSDKSINILSTTTSTYFRSPNCSRGVKSNHICRSKNFRYSIRNFWETHVGNYRLRREKNCRDNGEPQKRLLPDTYSSSRQVQLQGRNIQSRHI